MGAAVVRNHMKTGSCWHSLVELPQKSGNSLARCLPGSFVRIHQYQHAPDSPVTTLSRSKRPHRIEWSRYWRSRPGSLGSAIRGALPLGKRLARTGPSRYIPPFILAKQWSFHDRTGLQKRRRRPFTHSGAELPNRRSLDAGLYQPDRDRKSVV